ncbi:MAG: hypothetical protein RL414_178, partial [Actinomycetota bacterium]
WHLTEFDEHRGVQIAIKKINSVYSATPAMWEKDTSPEGFHWLVGADGDGNTLAFARWSDSGECLVAITNFSPVPHESYSLPLPFAGKWIEVLNTDDLAFGGSGVTNSSIDSIEGSATTLRLPPLATVWLKRL